MFKKAFEIIQLFIGGFFTVCFLFSLLPQFEVSNKIIFIIGLLSMIGFFLFFFQKLFNISVLRRVNFPNLMTLFMLCGLLIAPIVNRNSWESETILYYNGQFKSQTIEHQRKPSGDYEEHRIVRVVNCCHLISHITTIDTTNIKLPWLPVETGKNHILHP